MIINLKSFWLVKEQRAVATAFLALAVIIGSWITRLPQIQEALNLSDGFLGTALLCLPLGAVSLLPFYSKVINGLSQRVATLIGLFTLSVGLCVSTLADTLFMLMIALYVTGLGIGLTDVAMNAIAAEIEKQHKTQIMSTCHGFFSIGGMIGALLSMLAIRISVSLPVELLVLTIVFLLLLVAQRRSLLNAYDKNEPVSFTWPKPSLIALATVGLLVMMTEGGITDWSTIYIERTYAIKGYLAGLGFAGFSLMMALGRFLGDRFILKVPGKVLIRGGLTLAFAGLLLIHLSYVSLAIFGFSIAGLGLSVVVPIIFGKAAKTEGVSAAKGLSSVASAGYIGWLIGPVGIGYISELFGLDVSFLIMTMLCVMAFLISYKIN